MDRLSHKHTSHMCIVRSCFITSLLLFLAAAPASAQAPSEPKQNPDPKSAAELKLEEAQKEWMQGDALGLDAHKALLSEGDSIQTPIKLLNAQEEAYKNAERHFLEALKLNPDYLAAKSDYARFLASRKRYGPAKAALAETLAEKSAAQVFSQEERAYLFRTLGGLHERGGQQRLALDAYRQAFQLHPGDPRNRLSLAIAHCANGEPEHAIPVLEPWAGPAGVADGVKPELRALGLYTLAYAQEEMGEPEAALDNYGRARTLAQEAGEAERAGVAVQAKGARRRLHAWLRDLERQEKEERRRREDLEKAIAKEAAALRPDSAPPQETPPDYEPPRARMARAFKLLREGLALKATVLKDAAAFAEAQRALQDAPSPDAREALLAREPLKTFEQAKAGFKDAVQLWPGMARAHRELGLCYNVAGQYDEAGKHLDAAVLYDPRSQSNLAVQGELRLLLDEWEGALQTFEALLRVEPEYAPAHLGLARAAVLLHRNEVELNRVRDSLDRAHQLGVDRAQWATVMAQALFLQEKLAKGEPLPESPRHWAKEPEPKTGPKKIPEWKGLPFME